MRLSNVNDTRLQHLADQYREIGSKRIDPALFEELIDRRTAMSANYKLEASFAYEGACALIHRYCAEIETEQSGGWLNTIFSDSDLDRLDVLDLYDVECEVKEAILYLDSRRLIFRDQENLALIQICDEGEPVPQEVRS